MEMSIVDGTTTLPRTAQVNMSTTRTWLHATDDPTLGTQGEGKPFEERLFVKKDTIEEESLQSRSESLFVKKDTIEEESLQSRSERLSVKSGH